MEIKVCPGLFNPWQELQAFQDNKPEMVGKYGATSVFVGTMRDFNEGDDVKGMVLEHYPGMTERQLGVIVESAQQKWDVIDTLVVHRVGNIFPDETIVLVAVWSSHRGDAFDACRHVMEALKSKAPFWKKERLRTDEERWVEANTDGYQKIVV